MPKITKNSKKLATDNICVCGCNERIEYMSHTSKGLYKHGHNRGGVASFTGLKNRESKKIWFTCECGKEFWRYPSNIKNYDKSFCSKLCSNKSISTRTKVSTKQKQLWENGHYSARYSSYEVRLAPLLEAKGFIATYKNLFFVKVGSKIRVPDFINTDTKEIIEIFGTYWHRDRILPKSKRHETPEEYIAWYKQAGYDCKVVWAEEEFDEFMESLDA